MYYCHVKNVTAGERGVELSVVSSFRKRDFWYPLTWFVPIPDAPQSGNRENPSQIRENPDEIGTFGQSASLYSKVVPQRTGKGD